MQAEYTNPCMLESSTNAEDLKVESLMESLVELLKDASD